MWRDFHQEVVINIEFLVAKVKYLGVNSLRADLMELLMLKAEFGDEEEGEEEEDTEPLSEEDLANKQPEPTPEPEPPTAEMNAINDLFMTENKTQEPEVQPTPPPAETTPPPASGNADPDLACVLKDTQILLDIINLAIDGVRHRAESLPAQV